MSRRLPFSRMRAASGFTLVEVVIALSLLALVMLGLVSAMATFGRTATTMEGRFERGDEARLVSEFLRGALGRVPEHYRQRLDDARMAVMFEGSNSELRWLGVMPPRHGMGGLHHFRLSAAATEIGPSLALQYVPYLGGDTMPDWGAVEPRLLSGRITGFDIGYAGAGDEGWADAWVGEEELPQLVRLAIASEHGAWPDLIVRVRPANDSGSGMVVIGGGTR